MSTNGGSTFSPVDSVTSAVGGWSTKSIVTSATSTYCVLRFIATGSNSGTDMGLDNVQVSMQPSCSGTPVAGTLVNTGTTTCSLPLNTSLSVFGYSTGAGILYQWQSSFDNVTWTNIPGATNATYAASVPIPIMYYRFADSCSNSGLITYTSGIKLGNGHSYASLPFTESFESAPWLSDCNSYDAPNIYWQGSPYTGNNSWRQYDYGIDASWTNPTSTLYSPAASSGSWSASFHSPYASGAQGNLDLYINLGTAGTKQINFDYIGINGSNKLAVYLSTNGGSTFTALDSVTATVGGWSTKSLTTSATSTSCIIRFIATEINTGTDIGLDNVQVSVQPTCSGAPTAGTVVASATTTCTLPLSSDLTVFGYTTGAGILYQWQSSFDNVTWTNISGATNASYAASVPIPIMYYRFADSCTGSGMITYTSSVKLGNGHNYASLPFTESFESIWVSYCNTDDAPNQYWQGSPYTGNSSWRQYGQGADASWINPTTALYSPGGSVGSSSAEFHSYATSGQGTWTCTSTWGLRGRSRLILIILVLTAVTNWRSICPPTAVLPSRRWTA